MPAIASKNLGISPVASDLGMGLGGSDVLKDQLQNQSNELKKRKAMQAKLATGGPGNSAVVNDLGLGLGGQQ